MVEKARRERVERPDCEESTTQWEVFVRATEDDSLEHVGSVAASEAEDAIEYASRLFGWYAVDLWVCPSDAVERCSTRPLSSSTNEPTAGSGEPRVHEETMGTPRVNDR